MLCGLSVYVHYASLPNLLCGDKCIYLPADISDTRDHSLVIKINNKVR